MKQKPLLPPLRAKKRYLVYEVLSDSDFDAREISGAITSSMKEMVGNLGLADAGLIFFDNKFNSGNKRGFVRVSNKSLDDIRASFVFINDIKGIKTIVRSVLATGMIHKAEEAISSAS